ncbi:hypothetical protein [Zunongwangia sp.]|uniref:hypothetical protein n=1 Tax=Zunongwangia sp. TaxID=1965325 RepID=UPI003AA7E31F
MRLLSYIKTSFLYWIVIIVLSVLLITDSCCHTQQITTQTTSVETDTIKQIDSASNSAIKNRELEIVDVVEYKDSIKVIPKDSITSEKPMKKVYRYQDTTHFDQAIVYSEILSEGRILKLDLKTAINHLQTTITQTKTIREPVKGFFLKPNIDFVPGSIRSFGTDIVFIKGKIGASAGIAYALYHPENPIHFNLGILIKL